MELRRAVIFRIQTRGGSILSWIFVVIDEVEKIFPFIGTLLYNAWRYSSWNGILNSCSTFWQCCCG